MKALRILLLSFVLAFASAVAFAPRFSYADLIQIVASAIQGTVTYAVTPTNINAITNDAADTSRLLISGGGGIGGNSNRGAFIRLDGNEGANVGTAIVESGDASGAGVDINVQSSNGVVTFETNKVERFRIDASGNLLGNATNGGNVSLQIAGANFQVKGGGAAAKAGTFTCNGVTGVVISTTAASTSMALAFGISSFAGTAPIGAPYMSALTAGTNFTVKCSIAGETDVYNWAMINVN